MQNFTIKPMGLGKLSDSRVGSLNFTHKKINLENTFEKVMEKPIWQKLKKIEDNLEREIPHKHTTSCHLPDISHIKWDQTISDEFGPLHGAQEYPNIELYNLPENQIVKAEASECVNEGNAERLKQLMDNLGAHVTDNVQDVFVRQGLTNLDNVAADPFYREQKIMDDEAKADQDTQNMKKKTMADMFIERTQ